MNCRFLEWQKEQIFSYKYGYISRKSAIHLFVKEGFIPFIIKNGYLFSHNSETIGNTIASMLFYFSNNKFYNFYIPDNNYYNENWEHFNYLISYDMWNDLLEYWNNMFDGLLFCERAGIFGDLSVLAYQYLNLEKSPKYLEYIEENYTDTDEIKKEIDPYILDQMNKYTLYKDSRKND
jgi:hypothetical protein